MILKDCLEWGKSLKIICTLYFEYIVFYTFYNNKKENLWRCESIQMLSASSYEVDGILLCFRVFFSCIYFLRGICIPLFLLWFELLLLLLASCASDSWVSYNGCSVIRLLSVCYMTKPPVSLLDRYSVDWHRRVHTNNLQFTAQNNNNNKNIITSCSLKFGLSTRNINMLTYLSIIPDIL